MEKLEGYHGVLEKMMEEKRTINPIVGNVLSMAATAMGLAKGATTVGVSTAAVAAAVVAMATEVSTATEVATAQPSRHCWYIAVDTLSTLLGSLLLLSLMPP